MTIKLTPISVAMVLLLAGQAYASGGAAGDNGSGSMIGNQSVGKAGSSGATTVDGEDGGSFAEPSTIDSAPPGSSGVGEAGADSYGEGGGGAGGSGGGSVIGGISTGGAGGGSYSYSDSYSSANGGSGGNASGNTIEITAGPTLTGAAGGQGGSTSAVSSGGSGAAGHGGGSVFGGISTGGAGGGSMTTISPNTINSSSANGGNGGEVSGNSIYLDGMKLDGSSATGGQGGSLYFFSSFGGSGAAGHGGGSVFGGISTGGAGGKSETAYGDAVKYSSSSSANGGNGGKVSGNSIHLESVQIDGSGATGGNGGSIPASSLSFGGSGAAGHGGGSVFGGISTGGAAGDSNADSASVGSSFYSSANGGNGGEVSGNSIHLESVQLDGSSATGGQGGSISASSYGGSGAAGHGGGSVFGGISTGGAAGASNAYHESSFYSSANGGNGGEVSGNSIHLESVQLDGSSATGGQGGSISASSYGGSGAAGHGGGSVFGGISTGGAGGDSSNTTTTTTTANGGNGGEVSGNSIHLKSVQLDGSSATGGQGGSISASSYGGSGAAGHGGGSVFGGISTGGAGGGSTTTTTTTTTTTANGGNGGDVLSNEITLSGVTKLSGDIYGGISQGGAKGKTRELFTVTDGRDGQGGLVQNNIVTIIGDDFSIEGSIFGGLSINGDGSHNQDKNYTSYYAGNTLKIQSGNFELKGKIKNFQNYNWLLPENEFNGDVIITVASTGTAVDINNTIHKVDVAATGNTLDGGDQVILISKVNGDFDRVKSAGYLEQGFFIVYEAEMDVQDVTVGGSTNPGLVLTVVGVNDNNPDGKFHPESEEFLKGRVAQLAIVDQGADMISDGIYYARASLRKENANIFAIVDGGSSKYKNGGVSTLKLNDFKFALGAAKAFEFDNKSVGMISAFSEHGNGNYNSYNYFDYFGNTRGSGKVRYSGVGLMGHLDVAGTDVSKIKNKPNIFDDKYGLYLDAALRVGHVKVDFHSADMVNGQGVEARYNTKSRYASAMLGAGYVWTMDEKSAMDFYGRFTFSRMNGKDIQVADEQMNAGSAHSKRLRLGARYGYAYSAATTPYAGVAFERNFTGDVSGSAYGFTIKENSLKGNTGILEAGVMIKPKGADDPFSLRFGLQSYFGQRKGATADVRARYVF